MSEIFLQLEAQEQSQIYRAFSAELSRSPAVLEKDVWVCWVLQTLFTMPASLPMAFKGGTSLSKVFRAIHRFSEDVDVTLDYRGFDTSFDPFTKGVSQTQLKKFSEKLRTFMQEHVHSVVVPHFKKTLTAELGTDGYKIEVSANGEELRVHYPTVLGEPSSYIDNSVLIEFGGRNITDPNKKYEISPDIAELSPELVFPRSRVSVLSPERTFWEKATLIHSESWRGTFRPSVERLSRHWYDLFMLTDISIGQGALKNRDLLIDVVKHKKAFYNTNYAKYDDCLNGQLRLLPGDNVLKLLEEDFKRMTDAGMFIGTPPAFNRIIERLKLLETDMNKKEKTN